MLAQLDAPVVIPPMSSLCRAARSQASVQGDDFYGSCQPQSDVSGAGGLGHHVAVVLLSLKTLFCLDVSPS